jgi:hypothetical protein
MAAQFPLKPPQAILAYEAIVDIAPTASLGMGPAGERRIVNILGGTFEGPTIHGKVLPGGADRQLLRPDGILQLDAFYEMETDDGAVITVRNSAKVDYRPDGSRYAFSTLDLTAPDGQHAWINRTVFVGTVDVMRPSREAVIIRVYQLA